MNEITTSIKVDKEKWQKLKICLMEQEIKLKNWLEMEIITTLEEWKKQNENNKSTTDTKN